MRKFEFVKDEFRTYKESEAKIPTRATKNSAGYDFYTPISFIVPPHKIVKISTEIKANMGSNEFLMIVPRSSLGMKKRCMLTNTVGIIDSDFYSNPTNDGNISVELYNFSDKVAVFEAGERIVQGIFMKYQKNEDDNVKTKRVGGIGSTD